VNNPAMAVACCALCVAGAVVAEIETALADADQLGRCCGTRSQGRDARGGALRLGRSRVGARASATRPNRPLVSE